MRSRRLTFFLLVAAGGALSGCNPVNRIVSDRALGYQGMMDDLGVLPPLATRLCAQDVQIATRSGKKLQGWFFDCADPKGAIFFCSGHSGGCVWKADQARFLQQAGYQVFLYDYRGQGLSEGSPSLRDFPEDVRDAYQAFKGIKGLRADRIAVCGISLGSPMALMIMAEGPEVKCGVFESLYDPWYELRERVGSSVLSWFIKRWAFPTGIDLESWAGQVGDRPVLWIQPRYDIVSPPMRSVWSKMGERKRFWWVDAIHYPSTWILFGEEYKRQVLSLLERGLEGRSESLQIVSWSVEEKCRHATVGMLKAHQPKGERNPVRIVDVTGCLPFAPNLAQLPDSGRRMGTMTWNLDITMESRWIVPVGEEEEWIATFAWVDNKTGKPIQTAGMNEVYDVVCVLESSRRCPVEIVLFSVDKVDGALAPRGFSRVFAKKGRSTHRVLSSQKEVDIVIVTPFEGDDWPERQGFQTPYMRFDLRGPSGSAAVEFRKICGTLEKRRPSWATFASRMFFSRLCCLGLSQQETEQAGSLEAALVSLARQDAATAPLIASYLRYLYPDFKPQGGASWCETFLPRLEGHVRDFSWEAKNGRFRLQR